MANIKSKIQNQIESLKHDLARINRDIEYINSKEEKFEELSKNVNFNSLLNYNIKGTKLNFSNSVENLETLEKFLSDCSNNETLFMIDTRKRIWEIVYRNDLTITDFSKYKRINSIKNLFDLRNQTSITNIDLNYNFNLKESSKEKSLKTSPIKVKSKQEFLKITINNKNKSSDFDNISEAYEGMNFKDFEISFDSKFND